MIDPLIPVVLAVESVAPAARTNGKLLFVAPTKPPIVKLLGHTKVLGD